MSPSNPAYSPTPRDYEAMVEDLKPAAYVGCPVEHPTPNVLTGTGCATVRVEGKKSWLALPYSFDETDPDFAKQRQRKRPDTDSLRAERRTTSKAVRTADEVAKASPTAENLAAAEAAKTAALESMSKAINAAAGKASIHTCETPYPTPPHGPGVVVDAEATVLIGGYPLAREGDTILEAIGPLNKITVGCPTVLVGGAYYPEEIGEEEYNGIVIRGTRAFRARVREGLDSLRSKPVGKRIVEEMERQAASGDGSTIEYGSNTCLAYDPAAAEAAETERDKDGRVLVKTPGEGSGSTVTWNPNYELQCGGSTPRGSCSPDTMLGHELIHACHNGRGTAQKTDPYDDPGTPEFQKDRAKEVGGFSHVEEAKTIGQPPYESSGGGCPTENDLRKERGEDPRRSHYLDNECREQP